LISDISDCTVSDINARFVQICSVEISFSYADITHGSRTDVTDPLSILLEARFEPCQVCGEQSSGLHCGAITCEACKVKFDINKDFMLIGNLEIVFTIT
jgi:hypothetical protein